MSGTGTPATRGPRPQPSKTQQVSPAGAGGQPTQSPPKSPSPPPVRLPGTGFGGMSGLLHNLPLGRFYRAVHSNVTLGIAKQPRSGGGSPPLTPIVPALLALALLGFGFLARRFAPATDSPPGGPSSSCASMVLGSCRGVLIAWRDHIGKEKVDPVLAPHFSKPTLWV
jgi:hypothetical protein